MSGSKMAHNQAKIAPFNFVGGIYPRSYKPISTHQLHSIPTPETLQLSLYQPKAAPLTACVNVGDSVYAGQKIADSNLANAVPLFAPLAGKIQSISKAQPLTKEKCSVPVIELSVDKTQTPTNSTPIINSPEEMTQHTAASLLKAMANSGIRGLGGAGFATHLKLTQKNLNTLIINGVECEPYISCDDALMQHKAKQIIQAIQAMMYMLNITRCYFAIEDNKPLAINAIENAIKTQTNLALPAIELFILPYRYPSGGEKQLIKALTNQEVPSNQTATSIGIICHNVGTVFAIYEYLYLGAPLTKRLMSIAGDHLTTQNLWVYFGTPISYLRQVVNLSEKTAYQLKIGGPLTGFNIHNENAGIQANSHCLLLQKAHYNKELPCIRCGKCVPVCPSKLLPQQLYWFVKAEQHQKAEQHHLFDCIECGACDYVCPSDIPLSEYYHTGKQRIELKRLAEQKAQQAKLRHTQRDARIAQDLQAKEQKRNTRLQEKYNDNPETNEMTANEHLELAILQKKILAQKDRVQKSQQRLDMAIADNLSSVETLERALIKQQNKLQQLLSDEAENS